MTPSELKFNHKRAVPSSHFFDTDTMRYYGDTMVNYGVRSHDEKTWELYRKKPVKDGRQASAFFDKQTFKQLFPKNI